MSDEKAFIGFHGGALVLRAEGHITAALCPALKSRLLPFLAPDGGANRLHVDLSDCDYMDSTFLGLLVFLAKTARNQTLPPLLVHGANAQCTSLFRTMGMMKLLEFSDEPSPSGGSFEEIVSNESLNSRFLLDAHRELTALSPENRNRFDVLTAILEKDLAEHRPD
jgi:anti-anti-sigma factor